MLSSVEQGTRSGKAATKRGSAAGLTTKPAIEASSNISFASGRGDEDEHH